jgi:hypothetical protein
MPFTPPPRCFADFHYAAGYARHVIFAFRRYLPLFSFSRDIFDYAIFRRLPPLLPCFSYLLLPLRWLFMRATPC